MMGVRAFRHAFSSFANKRMPPLMQLAEAKRGVEEIGARERIRGPSVEDLQAWQFKVKDLRV